LYNADIVKIEVVQYMTSLFIINAYSC